MSDYLDLGTGPIACGVRVGDIIEITRQRPISGVTEVTSGGQVTAVAPNSIAYRTLNGREAVVGCPPTVDGMGIEVAHQDGRHTYIGRTSAVSSRNPGPAVADSSSTSSSAPDCADSRAAAAEKKRSSRELEMLLAERQLIGSLGEAGYRSGYYTGASDLAARDCPEFFDEWRSARNRYAVSGDQADLDELLSYVTHDNPPLREDVESVLPSTTLWRHDVAMFWALVVVLCGIVSVIMSAAGFHP